MLPALQAPAHRAAFVPNSNHAAVASANPLDFPFKRAVLVVKLSTASVVTRRWFTSRSLGLNCPAAKVKTRTSSMKPVKGPLVGVTPLAARANALVGVRGVMALLPRATPST